MSNLDNQPLRYWNGKAIYLTLYLTLGLTGAILLVFMLGAAQISAALLAFTPWLFLKGFLWQPFTYVLINPLDFFTPLLLFAFYAWGVEVEKYLGRRSFLLLTGTLVLLPVVVNLCWHWLGYSDSLAGLFYVASGYLIAFATLYPEMDYIMGWVPLKWFAFVCIACQSITYFPTHRWDGLSTLWVNCAAAFVMVRSSRGLLEFRFRWPSWLRRKPKFRVLPRPEERSARAPARPSATVTEAETEMDALLDKIARSGLQSLSTAERARLEKARQEMLKKES